MNKLSKKTLVFAIFFLALILTPIFLNQYYNHLLSPVSKSQEEGVLFVITPGQPIVTIAQNLKKNGLIKSPLAFRLLVAQMGIGKSIQAGDFKISPNQSSRDIAQELTHGAIDIWITLPEGLRTEEQAQKIEEKLKFGPNANFNFDKKQYIKAAKEGYMFPDTYLIPKDANAQMVAEKLLVTFNEKIEDSLFDASGTKLSKEETIILASLIEREARTAEEKKVIAGILINRLNIGMPLQVDASVQYAKGYDTAGNTWWPQISQEDYKTVRSPYNTYLNSDLPPGPISSPGIDSIKAALNPTETDYIYYLHDSQGKIHYAKTAQEHSQNIRNFL